MSIEIIIFPPKATRDVLRKHLLSLGFSKCEHLWDWPAGSLHFAWFEQRDFQSAEGVEATVFRPTDEERRQFGGGEWAVHTRTRASASPFDKGKQNTVIRSLRRTFGGNFHNDWHGRNRYTPVEKDSRGPTGRGICVIYESILDKLSAVEYSLPGPSIKLEGTGKFMKALGRIDPSRVVYNTVMPFTVAALEYFFRQAFTVLLRYDEQAKARLADSTRKVEISDAIAISRAQRTLEDVVAGWYSFQNLDSIHAAFKEWFGIDMWRLLRRRRKIGRRVATLDERLSKLIESRHGVIHRFEFDENITEEQTREMIATARVVMDVFVDYLEQDRGITIRA